MEDGLLVQVVTKHSTSDVLGRDCGEVASEIFHNSEKSATGSLILWWN